MSDLIMVLVLLILLVLVPLLLALVLIISLSFGSNIDSNAKLTTVDFSTDTSICLDHSLLWVLLLVQVIASLAIFKVNTILLLMVLIVFGTVAILVFFYAVTSLL